MPQSEFQRATEGAAEAEEGRASLCATAATGFHADIEETINWNFE